MLTCKGFALIFVSITCTPVDMPADQASFCANYEPTPWYAANPREQKEIIDRNNARWKQCNRTNPWAKAAAEAKK